MESDTYELWQNNHKYRTTGGLLAEDGMYVTQIMIRSQSAGIMDNRATENAFEFLIEKLRNRVKTGPKRKEKELSEEVVERQVVERVEKIWEIVRMVTVLESCKDSSTNEEKHCASLSLNLLPGVLISMFSLLAENHYEHLELTNALKKGLDRELQNTLRLLKSKEESQVSESKSTLATGIESRLSSDCNNVESELNTGSYAKSVHVRDDRHIDTSTVVIPENPEAQNTSEMKLDFEWDNYGVDVSVFEQKHDTIVGIGSRSSFTIEERMEEFYSTDHENSDDSFTEVSNEVLQGEKDQVCKTNGFFKTADSQGSSSWKMEHDLDSDTEHHESSIQKVEYEIIDKNSISAPTISATEQTITQEESKQDSTENLEVLNEIQEEQMYQQCLRKLKVIREIKEFDLSRLKHHTLEHEKRTYSGDKENEKRRKDRDQKVYDMNSSCRDPPLSKLEYSSHNCKYSNPLTGDPQCEKCLNKTPRCESESQTPVQKPGLEKQGSGACGRFSDTKMYRRTREEHRPRTDPPSVSLTLANDSSSVENQLNNVRYLCDSSWSGNSAGKIEKEIRPLKDPPKFHREGSDSMINSSDNRSRRAQEEHKPRKDPPSRSLQYQARRTNYVCSLQLHWMRLCAEPRQHNGLNNNIYSVL